MRTYTYTYVRTRTNTYISLLIVALYGAIHLFGNPVYYYAVLPPWGYAHRTEKRAYILVYQKLDGKDFV